jgi:nuclear pore complex protein Nup88
MGTEPVDGEGGVLGRGAVARSLAAAAFAAGEGGGALLAVVHQRMSASPAAPNEGTVAATLDVLILPREPAPAWAVLSEEDEAAAYEAASYDGGPVVTLTPLATDDDDASIQPLLAIDRVELASGESTLRRPKTSVSALQNELAPFVSVTWDPACRDRVFVCAGGAVHGVTLTWLAAVEGAVDDEEGEKSGGELSLPAVVTLMDSPEVLLGVAPCGDPLAEGLLLAVDATGAAYGLHPAPPLPEGIDATDDDDAVMSSAAAALAGDAEASAELRALAAGPSGPPPAPPAGAAALKPGTIEGNAALAAAATTLKERHLRYAHRVHAATKRHSLRLGAELRRQRVEANAIRDGLESVRRRKEILAQKIGQSVANHEDIRERLRKLAEAERSLPHPLTRAESAFQTTLQANADDLPLLEAKLEELKRRCEEIGEDFATMGRMAAGDHVSSFEKLAASDPEIAKEVESQDAATRANLERVRQIELAVDSLDDV